jgi:hypothetical protein
VSRNAPVERLQIVSEMPRRSGSAVPTHRLIGWGFVIVCLAMIMAARRPRQGEVAAAPQPGPVRVVPTAQGPGDAAQWFRRVKPYCNAVEITTVSRNDPPPPTMEGSAYHAACLGLAGRIDDARKVIDKLPPARRDNAAAIVFEVGHPVADAGDDRSAGPMMELVVDYSPRHYMALYHAGMSEYMLGQYQLARRNLRTFLDIYTAEDGWRSNAKDVIKRIDSGNREEQRRPREPGR